MQLPRYVQIEPVGQCNLRCQMCPIQFRQDGPPYGPLAFMQWDVYTGLIDQFGALEHLHLQGLGEPMMHPRFFEMVRYAVDRGIRVTTNTNFTLLNEARAEACVTCGMDELHVSIDGATAATYELIRTRSKFEKVMHSLELFSAARERCDSERPRLQIVMVVMRQNLEELPDLVRLAHRWSIDSIFAQHLCHDFGESTLPAQYRPMRDFVQEQTLLEEDPARIDHYFGAARAVAAELGVELRLPRTHVQPHPPGTPGRERCDWPWRGAYITYQGYAMPCCMVSTPDRIHMGNMAESGATAVWNGEAYRDFRTALSSDTPPEVCQSCAIYKGTF